MTSPSITRVTMGGATDVGVGRDENEDSYGLWGPEAGAWDFLIAVADGVGGHEHGKEASDLALEVFFRALTAQPLPHSDAEIRSAIATATSAANEAVYAAFSDADAARPGSTFTCVLAVGHKCYVGHVGDSRAYMVRGGRISQLSTDHTWVQLQVENGTMTSEEAAVSPYRNQVLRVLGAKPQVESDLVVRAIAPGDLFIVCSDGVTEHVGVNQLLEQSTTAASVEGLAQTLVALAVAQGGSDNATAVVARVPLQVTAGRAGAKPETTEIPLTEEPVTQPDPEAASQELSTVSSPSLGGSSFSRRDWRPVVASGLGVVFVLLGLVLLRMHRDDGERSHGLTAPVTPADATVSALAPDDAMQPPEKTPPPPTEIVPTIIIHQLLEEGNGKLLLRISSNSLIFINVSGAPNRQGVRRAVKRVSPTEIEYPFRSRDDFTSLQGGGASLRFTQGGGDAGHTWTAEGCISSHNIPASEIGDANTYTCTFVRGTTLIHLFDFALASVAGV